MTLALELCYSVQDNYSQIYGKYHIALFHLPAAQ
jgi:hypothetical protein